MNGLLLVTLLLTFTLAYFPVWKELFLVWYGSEDHSHGFLIVPIVIYALWKKRNELSRLPVQSSSFGVVLLIVSSIFYIFAYYAEIKTISSLSMISSIVGVVLFLFGFSILREISFILLFLFLMIPVPAQIYSLMTGPLQLFVSQVSVWFSKIIGIPIFREGNVIHLPEHTLEIVQACSGLRSLMSLLTVSMIISYFSLQSNFLRILLVALGVPAAIIINILRVLVIIVCFYFFDFDLTRGTVHTILGSLVFMFAIALVLLVKGVLSLWDRQVIEKA